MADGMSGQRVHVVDDDPSMRESMCVLLAAHGYLPEAHVSAAAYLANGAGEDQLCVFIDLRMPGMSGAELHSELLRLGTGTPTVIFTAHADIRTAVEAMKRRALDFIEKPASERDILMALEDAAAFRANRPRTAVPKAIVVQRLARLTRREREVLDHLVLGMTNKQIADELDISQRTVEIHRSRIREKMEARSLADLIRMVR